MSDEQDELIDPVVTSAKPFLILVAKEHAYPVASMAINRSADGVDPDPASNALEILRHQVRPECLDDFKKLLADPAFPRLELFAKTNIEIVIKYNPDLGPVCMLPPPPHPCPPTAIIEGTYRLVIKPDEPEAR